MTPPKMVPWAFVSLGIRTTRIEGSLRCETPPPRSDTFVLRSPGLADPGGAELRPDARDVPVGEVDRQRPVGEVVLPDVVNRRALGAHGERSLAERGLDLLRLDTRVDFLARIGERAREDGRADAGDRLRLAIQAVLPPARQPEGRAGEKDRARDHDVEERPDSLGSRHDAFPGGSPSSK